MRTRVKTKEVTGPKLTGLTVPLFPDKEAEIYEYGVELAAYLNNGGRSVKRLPYTEGAAKMLRRWASKLPALSTPMLKDIAALVESIKHERSNIQAPVRDGAIEPMLVLELDVPNPEAGLAYLLATVVSAGYGENLRQCLKHDCDLWYFDVPKGRRISYYCCKEHGNAERQRRNREKNKAKKRRHRK